MASSVEEKKDKSEVVKIKKKPKICIITVILN